MKKYEKPQVTVEIGEIEDIICTSGNIDDADNFYYFDEDGEL